MLSINQPLCLVRDTLLFIFNFALSHQNIRITLLTRNWREHDVLEQNTMFSPIFFVKRANSDLSNQCQTDH